MVDLFNHLNGPAGTNFSISNSASYGTAISHFITNGATDTPASSMAYLDNPAGSGQSVVRATLNSSNASYMRWDDSQSGTRFTIERDFYVPSTVSGTYTVMDIRSASPSIVASVVIDSTRGVMLTNPGTTNVIASRSAPLTPGSWYRVRLAVTKETASGAGNGVIELAVFQPDGVTQVHSYTKSDGTTGTGNPTQYRFANSSGSSAFSTDYISRIAAGPRSSGWAPIPALVLNTPVVAAGVTTKPSTIGGSDGSQVVTWTAISGATSYDAYRATGSNPAQGDFVLIQAGVTSPYTFTGQSAGTYSWGIKAKA